MTSVHLTASPNFRGSRSWLNPYWLAGDEEWLARNFISHISTPSLKKLQIIIPSWIDRFMGVQDPGPVSRIIQTSGIFTRSRPQLTHTHLVDRHHSLHSERLATLLEHDRVGPSLRTLIIHYDCCMTRPQGTIPAVHLRTQPLIQHLPASNAEGEFNVPSLQCIVLLMHELALSDCPDGTLTSILERHFRHGGLTFAGVEFPCERRGLERHWEEDGRHAEQLRQDGWDIEFILGAAEVESWDRKCVRRKWLKKADFFWDTFPIS